MRGARGEDEQLGQAEFERSFFDGGQQGVAASAALKFACHRKAGHFTGTGFGKRIQRNAADDAAIKFIDKKLFDFLLQAFT